jgi:CRP-like cAMP-binding protein
MSQQLGYLMPAAKSQAIFGPTQNKLLRMLPAFELSALLSNASEVSLQPAAILRTEDQSADHVYFPMSGIISLDIVLRNQQSIEAALVGYNAAVGLFAALGIDRAPGRAVVQAPGRAMRIPAAKFAALAERSPVIRDMIVKGVALQFWETQQNVACGATHDVQARLCRWLVRCHEFCYGEAIPLTQDFLARMLAVRRTTVTLAASALQDAGVIQYRRGVIQVLDRGALEHQSCECQSVLADQTERLMSSGLEMTPNATELPSVSSRSGG